MNHNPYARHTPYPDVHELSRQPREQPPYVAPACDTVDWPAIAVSEGELTVAAEALFCDAASKGMHLPTISFPDPLMQASRAGVHSDVGPSSRRP